MIELLLEAERALSMGRADRAETLYRQVADADPRNSIAVVGLARVALERADDAGALVLARRALAIDAENVAAQRLVQRLEEVIRTRGDALPEAEAPGAGQASDAGQAVSADPSPAAAGAATDDPPPVPRRPTPFDGDDPVLAPLPDARDPAPRHRPTPPEPPAAAPARRSLLDRLRGR